jgi:hypothetical protein
MDVPGRPESQRGTPGAIVESATRRTAAGRDLLAHGHAGHAQLAPRAVVALHEHAHGVAACAAVIRRDAVPIPP